MQNAHIERFKKTYPDEVVFWVSPGAFIIEGASRLFSSIVFRAYSFLIIMIVDFEEALVV
jgi:hypothetical protein